jgi:UDP-N-acetyl-D-glucosamine dehydrogenase
MKISIIGQGYVGLPLAIAFAEADCDVNGFDLNLELVERLKTGISHIEDVSSTKVKTLLNSGKYFPTSNPTDLGKTDVAIIAVPTPLNVERKPDLSCVISAATTLGKNLQKSALIINESTSFPGTLRNIIAKTVEENSFGKFKHLFAISPERVDPGNNKWSIKNTPRLYAGMTKEASSKTREVYGLICDDLIELSTPEIAEAAKLFENTFRQVNIALVNEFSLMCSELSINVHEVLDGASSKPYGFMKFTPGIGVGGHCIPVDPTYLSYAANSVGAKADFIDLANKVNFEMPEKLINNLESRLNMKLSGKKILIVGIAYKRDLGDTRESPAIRMMELLRLRGNEVKWHDSHVSIFKDEVSSDLETSKNELALITVAHTDLNLVTLLKSAEKVIDLTGTYRQLSLSIYQ